MLVAVNSSNNYSSLNSTHILGLVMHLFESKHKQNDLIAHDIKFYMYYTFSVCLQLDLY